VFGLSGSGKTTFARSLAEAARERGLTSERVKLAAPLYQLQDVVYAAAGAPPTDGRQDQILMESLASHLRRINPRALVDNFLLRLAQTNADVVINDDLRDPYVDAPVLRDHGFVLIQIVSPADLRTTRLASRGDLSVDPVAASSSHIDALQPAMVVVNDGSPEDLMRQARTVIRNTQ